MAFLFATRFPLQLVHRSVQPNGDDRQRRACNHNSRPSVPLHFAVAAMRFAAPVPQLHMPCPLPRVEANEHWFCKAASSSSPSGPGSKVVSVTEKPDAPGFWMLVDHAEMEPCGAIAVGSQDGLTDASAGTIFTTPELELRPVSGFPVKSVLTESVLRPSGDTRQPQHSESCWS